MKLNKKARELLDRYLLGVKRKLSGKEREDITNEIESYIFDTLEEKYANVDEITTNELEVVLKEMGAPIKVAGQFAQQRSLIGPRLFPIYILVLKILVGVVIGAITLGMIITTVLGESGNFWMTLLEYLGTIWSGALSTGGMVTLIFAIIEHCTEGKSLDELEELKELNEFKISDLPDLPAEEKQPGKVGLIVEIVLGVIGITFFSYIQSSGGLVPYFTNPWSEMQSLRLFTESFIQYVPFMIALAGLDIARNATILVQGYHSALTNWWEIITKGANVVLMVFLVQAFPIISLEGFQQIIGTEGFANLENLANIGIKIAMGLGIFGSIVDIIRKITREIRNPTI